MSSISKLNSNGLFWNSFQEMDYPIVVQSGNQVFTVINYLVDACQDSSIEKVVAAQLYVRRTLNQKTECSPNFL